MLDNVKNRYPRSVFLNVSGVCNLKCIYCSSESINDKNAVMDIGVFESLRKSLANIVVTNFIITGGEPFLHPSIFYMLDSLSQKSKVRVLTNGTLIERHMSRIQQLNRRRVSFAVSLDASKHDDNARTRVCKDQDSYGGTDSIIKNIKMLKAEGFTVDLNAVVTKHMSIDVLNNLIDKAKELNILSLSLSPIFPTGEVSNDIWSCLRPTHEIELYINTLSDPIISSGFPHFHLAGAGGVSSSNLLECGVASSFFAVSVNGDIYPCNYWPDKISNITKIDDFRKFWMNFDELSRIRQIKKMSTHDISACQGCESVGKCGGGCRARAYAYSGNILGKDPYCDIH